MQKAKLGLIGIVGDEAKHDFWDTMQRVAALGYTGIEAPGLPPDTNVTDAVRRLNDLGLEILTGSTSREQLRDELPAVIERAHALKTKRVSVWWAPCDTRQAVLYDAALYNNAGAQLANEGITLCYHHHHHEFLNVIDGITAFDLLVANTDSSAVKFIVDIAWATFGGQNPVTLIHRLKARASSLHVKDLSRLDEINHFTAVGTGVVDIQGSVRAALEHGIEWAVVEQDRLRNLNAFDTITLSALYLKEAGLV